MSVEDFLDHLWCYEYIGLCYFSPRVPAPSSDVMLHHILMTPDTKLVCSWLRVLVQI